MIRGKDGDYLLAVKGNQPGSEVAVEQLVLAACEAEFVRVRDTARAAAARGLGVNAGHDLDLKNLPRLAREVPEISEASIGHAIIADALYLGLAETIRRYVAACRGENVEAPRTR